MKAFFAILTFLVILGIMIWWTSEWQQYKIDSEELKRDFYRKNKLK